MNEYRLESDNLTASITRLQSILDHIPQKMKAYSDVEFSIAPSPEKWSKKQIVGHLIDSATNNHHRFVRAQFDHQPTILYDQEKWNKHGYYDQMDGGHLIDFWEWYNRHLIELVSRIPTDMLQKECGMEDGSTITIAWLFDDYVRHMEHHLKQIVRTGERESVRA